MKAVLALSVCLWTLAQAAPALAQSATITVVVTGDPRPVPPAVEPAPTQPDPVPVQMAGEASLMLPASDAAPTVVQGWDTGAEAGIALRIAIAVATAAVLRALRQRRALRWMLAG